MSAESPDQPFDAELAWDISEWPGIDADSELSREGVRSLAQYLSAKGYHNGEKPGIKASLKYIEEAGAKLADEFLPVFEAMRKKYDTEKK